MSAEHNIDIPSGRVRFSTQAMKEFEALPNCEIDMSVWRRHTNGTCYACFGGAALLKMMGIVPRPDNDSQWDSDLTIIGGTLNSFEDSLDLFRTGRIGDAFSEMGLSVNIGRKFNRTITSYHKDKGAFYADMEKLADVLEKAGY